MKTDLERARKDEENETTPSLLPPTVWKWWPLEKAFNYAPKCVVFPFQMVTEVEIAEFWLDVDGEFKKSRRGICLTPEQWRKLVAAIPHTDKKLEAIRSAAQ